MIDSLFVIRWYLYHAILSQSRNQVLVNIHAGCGSNETYHDSRNQVYHVCGKDKRRHIHRILARQNPWFNKNLPEYLMPLPDTEDDLCRPVDDAIAHELSKVKHGYNGVDEQSELTCCIKKMGYPEDKVQKALHAPENNHIKVAYQLVLDHKRMLKECKSKTRF